MARAKSDESRSIWAIDMTPMIDCTFNLLVFFLCNVNFRLLEGKLPLFLPREQGVLRQAIIERLEPLTIEIARRRTVDVRDPDWTWDDRQLDLRIQGRALSGVAELHRQLAAARSRDPEVRVLVRPRRGTLYIDTVKVVNECLRARATNVTFASVPADD